MMPVIIKAPAQLCIYRDDKNTDETVKFIRHLSTTARTNKVVLDLRDVKIVTGAACLILFAHVNCYQLFHKNVNWITFKFPKKEKNPSGYDYVVKRGLARALLSGSVAALEKLAASQFVLQSSNSPDTHAPLLIEKLSEVLDLDKTHDFVLQVNAAVNEAMLNVCHHAYSDLNTFFTGVLHNRWWQLAMYDKAQREFVFLIYDLGVGIVASYGASLEGRKPPQQLLEEAMSHGCSRFSRSEPWRGNGSEDIKHPIELEHNETLYIRCNAMRYLYRGHGTPAIIETTNVQLPGTLVEWTLRLGQGEKS